MELIVVVKHHWLYVDTVKAALADLRSALQNVTVLDVDQITTATLRYHLEHPTVNPVLFIAPDAPESLAQRVIANHLAWVTTAEQTQYATTVSTHVKSLDTLTDTVTKIKELLCLPSACCAS